MSNFWKRLRNRLFAPPPAPPEDTPRTAVPPVPRAALPGPGFPSTYSPSISNDDAARARVFDPALKHFSRAFRPGDPTFENDDAARRWTGLRRLVADHVLRAIAESEWGDRLILRGSRLSKAWLGDAAREPGDLDWLVDPPTIGPDDWAGGPRDGLIGAVFARPAPTGVELVRGEVATDTIWTYERAEGRRVAIPWRAVGLPGGAVQVDVVFRESLAEPDRRTAIPAADGGCVSVRAAGPAQSLAWKLLWLATDWYPQGKDLYDAVLLAERFALPRAVLDRTFRLTDARVPATSAALVKIRNVDWKNFLTEYPWVGGSAADWLARLATAIGPTFGESDVRRPEDAPDEMDPGWLTTTVVQLARGIDAERAYDRLPILADALEDAGCDNRDVLDHCRCDGPHAGRCWVVDFVLGKG